MWVCLTARSPKQHSQCSVEVPPTSSAAPAPWYLPLITSMKCVSPQTSLLSPLSRICSFFDRSYLKEYQKCVFGALCFCLASYAFSKTPVPPLDTSFSLLIPQHLLCTPSSTFAGKLDAEPCHLSTSCVVSLPFIWAHG